MTRPTDAPMTEGETDRRIEIRALRRPHHAFR
jgi:hypothetical protein